MHLRFELVTPLDLLRKLRRDFAQLDDEVSADSIFNFVVTAWSLTDWLIKAEWRDQLATDRATRGKAVDALRKNVPIRVCRDIANGSKHFVLDYPPMVERTEVHRGWGSGRWGRGRWGDFEPTYLVFVDGKSLNVLEIARDALLLFEAFFVDHDVQPYDPSSALTVKPDSNNNLLDG